MSHYMDYVNQLAIQNVKNGGDPFAACIVYQDRIIAKGVNETHFKNQVSRHAELIAIENAQKVLNSSDLSSCILYASGHPCPMCLGAIGFSKIQEVYYHNTLEDAENINLGLSTEIYKYIKDETSSLKLRMKKQIGKNDAMVYYKTFKDTSK